MAWDDEDDLDVSHFSPVGASNGRAAGLPSQPGATSSAPFNILAGIDSDEDGNQDADALGVDDEVVVKKRRVTVKLDEDKLMSARGIPYLQAKVHSKLTTRLRKKKGSELKDLDHMIQFYQLWAHALYPRANFEDFVHLARTTGKKPKMRMFRRNWIAEEKGKGLGVDAQYGDDVNNGSGVDSGTVSVSLVSTAPKAPAPANDPNSLFVGNVDEDDFMDDFDDAGLDEIQGLSEPRIDSLTISSSTTSRTASSVPSAGRSRHQPFIVDDENDDDDGLYDMPASYISRNKPTSSASSGAALRVTSGTRAQTEVDDDDLMELMTRSNPATKRQIHVLDDEDELDELERLIDHPPGSNPAPVVDAKTAAKRAKPIEISDEMDMDMDDLDDDELLGLLDDEEDIFNKNDKSVSEQDKNTNKKDTTPISILDNDLASSDVEFVDAELDEESHPPPTSAAVPNAPTVTTAPAVPTVHTNTAETAETAIITAEEVEEVEDFEQEAFDSVQGLGF